MFWTPIIFESLGTNIGDETLQQLENNILLVYTMMMQLAVCNTHYLLNPNELEEGGQQTINHNKGVIHILTQMACQ